VETKATFTLEFVLLRTMTVRFWVPDLLFIDPKLQDDGVIVSETTGIYSKIRRKITDKNLFIYKVIHTEKRYL